MLLDDAKKIRAAKKLGKESENIVLRPAVAAQLMDFESTPNTVVIPNETVLPCGPSKSMDEFLKESKSQKRRKKIQTKKPRNAKTKKGK